FSQPKTDFLNFLFICKKPAVTDRYFRFFTYKSVGFGRFACKTPPTETERLVGEKTKNRPSQFSFSVHNPDRATLPSGLNAVRVKMGVAPLHKHHYCGKLKVMQIPLKCP
ncbi:unnamed protein product, partial [Laminaria digitata]